MNLLQRVRDRYSLLSQPKALSHRPDLAGREHVYRQGAGQIVQAMDSYADYASVYEVYTWVRKAISMVAENLAGLPVRAVDGNGKAIDMHPLTELFAHVNDEQTPIDLWQMYTVNMMLGGEAPYEIVPDKQGRPVEIWLRRPDRVAVVPDATRLEYPTAVGYIYEPEEATAHSIAIEAAWMVFDKFYNPLNPWRGLAPIHAVREGITIDMFAQSWSKGFLKNNVRPDFAIIAPEGLTKTEKDDYEARFMNRHQGIQNAHLPVILEGGVTDIKTLSFPPKDVEWLQQREFARDEVGAIFGVPDELMGFGKNTYENFETALTVFWTLTMLPLIRRRDTTLTQHFRRFGLGLGPKESIATDLSSVGQLQEDLTPKVDLGRKFFDMGVPFNKIDEMLSLGVGPVEGGDVGYLASTLKTIDQIQNPPEPPPMLSPIGGGNDAPKDDGDSTPPPKEDAPQQRMYLPDGAKEQAKRALKKVIQQVQDSHLRAIRGGCLWQFPSVDDAELRRWTGDQAKEVIQNVRDSMPAVDEGHDAMSAFYNALKSDDSLTKLLEVEASAPFFTGLITHEVYKALVLELDPDDDEAEQAIRMEIERRFERELSGAFKEQLGDLLPEDASDEVIRNAPNQVEATSQPVREILRKELEQSASLGVSVSLDTLEQIGLGFDWTLAHADASRWASQYSYELIRGINSTTQARMQVAVNDWFNERTTLRDLVRELEPTFGRKRAKLIAITETTRAAREGSIVGYEHSGVVQEVEWSTVRDERVCPICGGLHAKRATLRGTFEGGKSHPPAHPGCRCFIRPVIGDN
jgi:HK97 family phage portal protein